MPTRAFLLCSDEKALDAVTQVFAELEISFEHFHDPALAVRRLGVQRFDIVLVDCDNVENATIVFDNLRKSNLNQSSISIAIVDGKAGVPTAFRLGAGLVMTKPLSLEQAKGTLRNAIAMQRKETPETRAFAAAASRGATPAGATLAPHQGQRAGDPPTTIVRRAVLPVQQEPLPQSPPMASLPAEMRPDMAASELDAVSKDKIFPGANAASDVRASDVGSSVLKTGKNLFERPSKGISTPPATTPSPQKSTIPPFNQAADAPRAFKSEFVPAELRKGTHSGKMGASQAADYREPVSDLDDPDEFAGLAPMAQTAQSVPSFGMIGVSRKSSSSKKPNIFLLSAFTILLLAATAYWAWTSQPEFRTMVLAQYEKVHFLITGASSHPQTVAARVPVPSQAVTPPSPSGAGDGKTPEGKTSEGSPSEASVPDGFAPQPTAPAQGFAEPATSGKPSSAPVLLATSGSKKDTTSVVNVKVSDTSEPIMVPEDIADQHVAYRVRPNYPEGVHRKGLQGAVLLTASVNQDGTVDSVKVISGDSQLSAAAVEAVQQWRYSPYYHNGKPAAFQTEVTVQFQPPQKKTR